MRYCKICGSNMRKTRHGYFCDTCYQFWDERLVGIVDGYEESGDNMSTKYEQDESLMTEQGTPWPCECLRCKRSVPGKWDIFGEYAVYVCECGDIRVLPYREYEKKQQQARGF